MVGKKSQRCYSDNFKNDAVRLLKEYACDEDGDGYCEVHCNMVEGIWTDIRNFLRPFEGVHKQYLALQCH